MSISLVRSGNGGGLDQSRMASIASSNMMKDLDPNKTGEVTKDQFISGMTAKGVSNADATKMYESIDVKKSGSIGKSEIEAAIKAGNLKPPPGGGPHGRPPPGGPGGPDGANKSGSTNSSSTSYVTADTNKDGVVSVQEAAIYAVKNPSKSATDSTQTGMSKLGSNVDKLV